MPPCTRCISTLALSTCARACTRADTGPVFTATFAWLLLGERIDWSFYPIVLLDACGLVLITQPSFLFSASAAASKAAADGVDDSSYLMGALSSLCSAVIAGLLPVCTRKSKECHWTAVNHVSSALSAFLFTPIGFAVWFATDVTAMEQSASSFDALAEQGGGGDGAAGVHLGRWPLLLGATVTGFAGLALQTLGYQREEAAKASVMTILEIPFAYLLQAVVFHDEITALGLGGVGLVACGTMLNLLRHLQRATAQPTAQSESGA